MKVIFKKNHRLGGKQFIKDDIANIHHVEAMQLIKKKIAEETNVITEEDKVLKQIRDGDNGEN